MSAVSKIKAIIAASNAIHALHCEFREEMFLSHGCSAITEITERHDYSELLREALRDLAAASQDEMKRAAIMDSVSTATDANDLLYSFQVYSE